MVEVRIIPMLMVQMMEPGTIRKETKCLNWCLQSYTYPVIEIILDRLDLSTCHTA